MSNSEPLLQCNNVTEFHTDLGKFESANVEDGSFNEGDVVEMTTKECLQLNRRLGPDTTITALCKSSNIILWHIKHVST